MLEDIKTSIMLGPLLVYQKVDLSTAIVEALAHNFPYAIQLRCFYFKKNIEHKC